MRLATLSSLALALLLAGVASAKLPPLSDEAKAKAEEARAKTAWSDKVAAFQTCKAEDRAAARYEADAKKVGKDVKISPEAVPCTDPGPFVYTPPGAASAPAAAAAPAASAAGADKKS